MEQIKNSFAQLSISPDPETPKQCARKIRLSVLFLLIQLIALISSAAFFFNYIGDDVETSLYALIQIAAFSCSIYTLIVGIKRRQSIQQIFSEFQHIRDECMFNPCSIHFKKLFF